MAWTSPATFTDGNVLTAAQLNAQVRDNLLESMPGKAAGVLRHFVTTGANAIVERRLVTAFIEQREITGSTSFVDLATVGPSVTVTTGTVALAMWTVRTENVSANTTCHAAIAISGATTSAASDSQGLIIRNYLAATEKRQSITHMFSGLTAGSNTFKLRYKTNAGTAAFAQRELTIWAF